MGFIRDYLFRCKNRRIIKGMFGPYVSPALVEQRVSSGKVPRLDGEDRESSTGIVT